MISRRNLLSSIASAVALRYLPELHAPPRIDLDDTVLVTTYYYPNGSTMLVNGRAYDLWSGQAEHDGRRRQAVNIRSIDSASGRHRGAQRHPHHTFYYGKWADAPHRDL